MAVVVPLITPIVPFTGRATHRPAQHRASAGPSRRRPTASSLSRARARRSRSLRSGGLLALRAERNGDEFIFGATGRAPFSPSYVRATADKAWRVAGISRVTLHECRHGYASFLDAYLHGEGATVTGLPLTGAHSGAQSTDSASFERKGTRFLNRVHKFDSCRGHRDLRSGQARASGRAQTGHAIHR